MTVGAERHATGRHHTGPDLRPDRARVLASALDRARFEVLPLARTPDEVAESVPRHLTLTVTASPRRGIDATVTVAEALRRLGYRTVPHLAARLVRDDAHLLELLQRLDDAGIHSIFAVGGDGEPIGEFVDSIGLLAAIRRLQPREVGGPSAEVGIAGYPDGHPRIPSRQLSEALLAKQPSADYVVTQMCFDADLIRRWVHGLREAGAHLPVYVGVPGPVPRSTLLRVAGRIGVGASASFLRRHRHPLWRLLRPGGYRPSPLLRRLAPELSDPGRGVAGLHVYTLGAVAATERWRRRELQRLGEEASRR